ncbi:MAG TPA: hypothetical protein DCP89_05260, partial [Acidimicrobiaceae bacterium]|nr:hypothetical protein [Acidimicrobiaceae bacterium]
YMHAWKVGLKTTYYLRSRPATRINQTNSDEGTDNTVIDPPQNFTDEEALACSLENPESCEACD